MKLLLYTVLIFTIQSNFCSELYENRPTQFLYAPWRSNYNSDNKPKDNDSSINSCPLCRNIDSNDDKKNYILSRHKSAIIQLNLFPYNKGHILIVPSTHKRDLHEFNEQERFDLMQLMSQSSIILQDTLKSDGINIGINIGKPAGASIPNHLHIHILPRWQDDNYFLSMLAQTRIISADLNKIYEILKPKFDAIKI